MTASPPAMDDDAWVATVLTKWLDELDRALAAGPDEAAEHFVEDAHWRDLVAFTWSIGQVHGRENIRDQLAATLKATEPRSWRISKARPAPRRAVVFDREVVEGFVDFE